MPLIIILMILFSLGGTTEGMAEETLGFYGLVIPLMLHLGYDRLSAASVILIGAGVGTLPRRSTHSRPAPPPMGPTYPSATVSACGS